MLNYIWAGLIILSLVFALVADVSDLRHDTYRNGQPLALSVVFPGKYDPYARRLPVIVRGDSIAVSAHYGKPVGLSGRYPGELIQTANGAEIHFA
ncbi:MAG TPA: hypothetical protein VG817_03425, partial [Gemmatimonadales bacterium]|nr:hypothetical protein [Gemmatimonadales bacterium]